MKIHVLFFILFFSYYALYGQLYNRQPDFLRANSFWVFGENAGLDLSSGSPTGIPTTVYGPEGRASVADPASGRLLFYTNGNKVWNRNQRVMPNGSDLYGNINVSSVQGACIVPVIDSPGKYYVFSVLGITNIGPNFVYPTPAGSLYYSVVDMDLDGGLGDIIHNRKNILLDTSKVLSEAMIAIPGNNCDIWLLVHAYGEPVFKTYRITADGVHPDPVISVAGQQISAQLPPGFQQPYGAGSMVVSPDRQRIVISSHYSSLASIRMADGAAGVLICKFDPNTGIVSDAIEIEKNILTYGPAAFSPDSKLLYVPSFDELSINKGEYLFQYDVTSFDSLAISTSKIVIDSGLTKNYQKASLKLYGDSIYVSISQNTSVGVIARPDVRGTGCSYRPSVLPLYYGSTTGYALPNEVVYTMSPDSVYTLAYDTFFCSGISGGLPLHPGIIHDGYAYQWNTGSADSVLTINEEGTYWVSYSNGCHFYVDTFEVQTSDIEAVIRVDTFNLSTTVPYKTYQWLLNGQVIPGATSAVYTVTENGDYAVVVTDDRGCVDTSEIYKVTNVKGAFITDLPGETIRVYPNPAIDEVMVSTPAEINITITSVEGRVVKRMDKAGSVNISNLQVGIYFMCFYDKDRNLIKVEKLIKR